LRGKEQTRGKRINVLSFIRYPYRTDIIMKLDKQSIFTLLALFIITQRWCHKNPSSPNTGTLIGTVLLEGQPVCAGRQDHSGITVALTPLDDEQKNVNYDT